MNISTEYGGFNNACVELERRLRARSRWRTVRSHVDLRRYAFHWIEVYAMTQEERRIQRANDGVLDDW